MGRGGPGDPGRGVIQDQRKTKEYNRELARTVPEKQRPVGLHFAQFVGSAVDVKKESHLRNGKLSSQSALASETKRSRRCWWGGILGALSSTSVGVQ